MLVEGKWYYSFGTVESFNSPAYDTLQECIADAIQEIDEEHLEIDNESFLITKGGDRTKLFLIDIRSLAEIFP